MADIDAIDQSPFGINCHVASDEMLDLMADAGIRWYRFDLSWADAEPQQGSYDWAVPDRLVAWAERRGVSLLAVLAYAPQWAWASGQKKAQKHDQGQVPSSEAEWVTFVKASAGRYRKRIHAYSIWNEPNVYRFWQGERDLYLQLILKPGVAALREVDEGLVVVGPDLASSPKQGKPATWLEPILKSGVRFDVLAHHQYDGGDQVNGRMIEIEKIHAVASRHHPPVPLWITEIGFCVPSETPNRESQAATLEAVMAAMGTRPWWSKTFWYDSHGEGWGLFEGENRVTCPGYDRYRAVIQKDELSCEVASRIADALLGRAPSGSELRRFQREASGSIEKLVHRLIASTESAAFMAAIPPADLSARFYRLLLGREPDDGGLSATVQAIEAGQLANRVMEMAQADEFRTSVAATVDARRAGISSTA